MRVLYGFMKEKNIVVKEMLQDHDATKKLLTYIVECYSLCGTKLSL